MYAPTKEYGRGCLKRQRNSPSVAGPFPPGGLISGRSFDLLSDVLQGVMPKPGVSDVLRHGGQFVPIDERRLEQDDPRLRPSWVGFVRNTHRNNASRVSSVTSRGLTGDPQRSA